MFSDIARCHHQECVGMSENVLISTAVGNNYPLSMLQLKND